MIETETTVDLYGRIGVTYEVIGWTQAVQVANNDLLICPDPDCRCAMLVMGCSIESGTHKLHLVREGQTWYQRETARFPLDRWVYLARPSV